MESSAQTLLVASGAAGGAVLRWVIALQLRHHPFPWGTLLVNLVGSFLLGFLALSARERPNMYLFMGVGFCGGLTTFSTFSLELVKLLETQRWWLALAYLAASVLLGFAGAYLAYHFLKDSQTG